MNESAERVCSSCGARNRLTQKQLLAMTQSPRCGRCRVPLLGAYDKALHRMDPSHYVHPLDRQLLEALQAIPGVKTLLRRLVAETFERAWQLFHQANHIRVTVRQLPELRQVYEEAGARLGVDVLPALYVFQDPLPNAYTYGVREPLVAVSSGLIELLEDDEVLAVLAHELGHWQCNHVLYKTAARLFGTLTSVVASATLGLGRLALMPIHAALLRWDRASELTADRAALLAARRPETVLRALMKLAGGSRSIYQAMNLDEFLAQAADFRRMKDQNLLTKALVGYDVLFRTHPYPIWRTEEAVTWVMEGSFLDILDGTYPTTSPVATTPCAGCGRPVPEGQPLCSDCDAQGEAEQPAADRSPWEDARTRARQVINDVFDQFK